MVTGKNNPQIVSIGGGTGLPVVNQALLISGHTDITSIVTVMDSGGITGRMRTDSRGQEVAYSDGLRTLLSLIPPNEQSSPRARALQEVLRSRNPWGQDLGYLFFSHFFDNQTGFDRITQLLSQLTGIKFAGTVLPVTTSSANLMIRTKSGRLLTGEHELDNQRMSADTVRSIRLDRPSTAYPPATSAIENCDVLIFSCGSLYGSVIANLLPYGIVSALAASRAKKILITNLMSTRNETHNFTPADFVKVFQKYTGLGAPLDYLLIPDLSRRGFNRRYPQVTKRYDLEQSYFLGWEPDKYHLPGTTILPHHATVVDPVLGRVRHDPVKLARALRQII